jgi:hypothetical protein
MGFRGQHERIPGSFKKFFKWMGERGLASPETVDDVLFMLKDSRNEFLRKVAE